MIPTLPLTNWKDAFRGRAKLLREDAAKRQPNAGQFAAAHFQKTFLDGSPPPTIALYHPKGDELDTWPLAEGLMELGATVLLPVVVDKKSPLIFRHFTLEAPLVEGRFGIMEPPESAPEAIPDMLVVPLLGIRWDGARLGMGGGFYDRTLSHLRQEHAIHAIGYGYAAQKLDRFPVGPHDEFLDGFVSEQGAERFANRS